MKIKLLVLALFFTSIGVNSQTNMVTSNIQSHLVNKYWSSDATSTSKVVFQFTQNDLSLYMNKNKIGTENYYLAEYNEVQDSFSFDSAKIGRISAGNHIVTKKAIYVIEFYPDYKSFMIKTTIDPDTKFQTYYLAEEFVPNQA
ncbi:hypothetical protein [Aestuariibaculum sediminum]|uniref:Uncharacterized protein n=1 Tax=Aestuariibaculum sediminum TaxID=2770637 RepID=A0A8J6UG89_9FLAO|nr:hypothetical protein [Aestuariibaculum sediminum]MBD0832036.1 hypothetical protein [Aestuariibaculum sediminum]